MTSKRSKMGRLVSRVFFACALLHSAAAQVTSAPTPTPGAFSDFGMGVQQVHLAQGKTPSTMVVCMHNLISQSVDSRLLLSPCLYPSSTPIHPQVSWVTDYVSSNIVRYGTKPGQLTMTATSTDVVQYTAFNVTSGYIHHVPLTNLKPSTTYFYLIDPPTNPDGAAGLRYFTTLPKVGKRVKDFQIAVAADIGQTNDSLLTIDHLIANAESQMLILAGDTSYANCDPPDWDYWFNIMQVRSSTQHIMNEHSTLVVNRLGFTNIYCNAHLDRLATHLPSRTPSSAL